MRLLSLLGFLRRWNDLIGGFFSRLDHEKGYSDRCALGLLGGG